jgi:predicted Zn-dependent protease
VKIAGDDGEPAYTVTIDGSGRYAWQRELPSGLSERVVCDGTTLWHLYPGIGVGSSRKVAAAHRAELNGLIPWWIAPADELAVGADLVMAGDRTIAIVPKNVGAPATQPASQPATDVHLHLVFGDDGRLIEQRAVEAPGGKVLARQTYAADGTIKLFDEAGKEIESLKYERTAAAEAPSLTPDAEKLVVLPLPYRTWEHFIASRGLQDDGQFNGWKTDDILAAIASNIAANRGNLPRLIGVGFFNKNDLRIGFYTLLLATGQGHNLKTTHDIGWNQKVTFDPEKHAAGTPLAGLAKYIIDQSKVQQQGMSTDLPVPAEGGDKLVNNLARLRYLYARMTGGRFNNADEARKNADRKIAVELVRDSRDPMFGWSVLTLLQNYGHFNQDLYREMADAVKKLEKVSGFAYAARYEQAKMLSQAGQHTDARRIFEELYANALEAGELPPIDHYFRNAFYQEEGSRERFTQMIRDAAAKLTAKAGRPAAVYLAWQMYQVGEQPLAEDLLGVALAELPREQRLSTTLAAIEYLWHSGQHARADKLLEPLLEDEKYKEYSELWRIAGAIAQQRGMLARSLACQEKAIDLDYQQLPEVVDLQWVRSDYGNLMAQYQRLADAVATLEKEPPKELLARTIRAADRWRAIDPDDTQACHYAAAVLRRLGAVELAWDYLTTPLADKPNEAAPWQSMAQQLKQQGDFDLADKAYATAYELETTNAQLLWERAQLLQQTQKHEEARKLYRQIADGKWQPRFQWIQQQARNYAR